VLNFLKPRPSLKDEAIRLASYDLSAAAREKLVFFLENAPDRELYHLNPRYFMERQETEERETMRLLLAAVHEGLMTLHWDVRCPACGQPDQRAASLADLHATLECPACHNRYEPALDNEVRVTFSLHPRLRRLAPAADDLPFRQAIEARLGAVTGQNLLLLPDFQQLFPRERLLPDESLVVSRIALIFTDLAGSTALYAARGDPRAYHLVRLHFDTLFEAAEAHGGTVVKNIGDAIMAAFHQPDQALAAALDMQTGIMALNRRQQLEDPEALILKIGLHCGPCLNVTLNERLDYFGTTVNIAARVQTLSRGHDLVFTDPIRNDAAAAGLLDGRPVESLTTLLKGLDEPLRAHRLVLKAD
jgi:class 3 adenylate cyclase